MNNNIVYRVEMKFKEGLEEEKYAELKQIAQAAYDNRCGCVLDSCTDKDKCIFEGDQFIHDSLIVAEEGIDGNELIFPFLEEWNWIDMEYPEESDSILEACKK